MSLALPSPYNITAPSDWPTPFSSYITDEACKAATAFSPTKESVERKAQEFFQELRASFPQKNKRTLPPTQYKALEHIMCHPHLIPEHTMKASLMKEKGYLKRLFSHESWEEWTENRTALGRVVALYRDFIENSLDAHHFMRHLHSSLVQEADIAAKKLLEKRQLKQPNGATLYQECLPSLVLGSIGSLATSNPLFFSIGSLHCLGTAQAQAGRSPNVATARQMASRRDQILAKQEQLRKSVGAQDQQPLATRIGYNPALQPELLNSLRAQLIKELSDQLPGSMKRLWQEGTNWIDCVLSGISHFLLDVTGIMTPVYQLQDRISEIEDHYWMNQVYDEYIKIFREPEPLSRPENLTKYKIQMMRDKLSSYGYHIGHGTPLQFIRWLKRSGTCEKYSCPRDEL